MCETAKLTALIEKWEKTARNKFRSAERQIDDPAHRPTGERFIEHGAMCYFNCAQELRAVLSSLSPSVKVTDTDLREVAKTISKELKKLKF